MGTLLLIIIVVGLILYMRSKPANPAQSDNSNLLEQTDQAYQQGYVEGYQAAAKRLQQALDDGTTISDEFATVMLNEYGEPVASEPEPEPEPVPLFGKAAEPARILSQVEVEVPVEEEIAEPVKPKVPAKTAEERETQNINTMLYVASFMLVGAAVLFIGTSLPELAKFFGLLVVTFAFYSSGMVIHAKSERLRPAAVAFVGTGLAIVPFVGLAFYAYVAQDGPLAWWLTSLLGIALYFGALLRLRSRIITYASLGFVYSFTLSSVSVLGMPFVWYMLAIIVLGSFMSWLAIVKPSWLPEEVNQPMEQNGEAAVLIAIIGSVFVSSRIEIIDYALIAWVSALHYTIAALGVIDSVDKRAVNWSLARGFGLSSAVLATYASTDSLVAVGVAIAISALAVHAYSLWRRADVYEDWWLAASQVLMIVACLFWAPDNWWHVVVGLVGLAGLSAMQTVVLGKDVHGAGLLVAAVCLPVVLLAGALDLTHAFEWIAATTLVLGVAMLALRATTKQLHWQTIATAGYALLYVEAFLASWSTGQSVWYGAVTAIIGLMMFAAAFVERAPSLHAVSNVLIVIACVFWAPDWWYVLLGLFGLVGISVAQTMLLRKDAYGAGLLIGATAIPVVFFAGALDHTHASEWIAATTLALGVAFFGLRATTKQTHWQVIATTGYGLLYAEAILTSYITEQNLWYGSVTAIVGLLLFAAAFVERSHSLHAFSNVLLVLACLFYAPDWWYVTASLLGLAAVSSVQTDLLKRAAYGMGLIICAVFLPIVFFGGVLDIQAIYVAKWTVAAVLAICLGFFALRAMTAQAHWQKVGSVGYAILSAEAIFVSMFTFQSVWFGTVVAIVGVMLFVASSVERKPMLHVVSNALLFVATWVFVAETSIGAGWQLLVTAWLTSVAWYALRWWFESEKDSERVDIMTVSSLATLLVVGMLSAFYVSDVTVAAVLSVCVGAAALGYEGYVRKQPVLYEVAIVISSLALQRLVYEVYPDADALVYTHWWAAVAGAIALLRYRRGDIAGAKTRSIIALSVLTVPTGLAALSQGGVYQQVFLLEHVALLVGGAMTNKRLAIVWATVTVVLALLWMLRGYTYLLLALLGVGLLALAIWRLLRKNTSNSL